MYNLKKKLKSLKRNVFKKKSLSNEKKKNPTFPPSHISIGHYNDGVDFFFFFEKKSYYYY